MREFPQLKFNRALSLQEYETLENIDEDFVITTIRLTGKNKPMVKIAPFLLPIN